MYIDKRVSCCFTGHRHVGGKEAESVVKRLYSTLESLCNHGIENFLCGGAIGFDLMAAACVEALKEQGHNIHLIMVLPCKEQDKYWSAQQQELRNTLIAEADEVILLSDEYRDGCMKKRNAYLVSNSAVCVCYVRRQNSGAGQTMRMAQKNGLRIIRL